MNHINEVSRRKSASPWSRSDAPCSMAFMRNGIRSWPAHFAASPEERRPLRKSSMAAVTVIKSANSSAFTCSSSKTSLGHSMVMVDAVVGIVRVYAIYGGMQEGREGRFDRAIKLGIF